MQNSGLPKQETDEQIDPNGSFFGTDGAGFEHYYQMGARRMTVVDQAAGAELAGIVAQTLPVPGDLPEFNQFRVICSVSQDTIDRVATEEL